MKKTILLLIGKILTEQQYEGYLKIRPQFASQRKFRDFLLGNQNMCKSVGILILMADV